MPTRLRNCRRDRPQGGSHPMQRSHLVMMYSLKYSCPHSSCRILYAWIHFGTTEQVARRQSGGLRPPLAENSYFVVILSFRHTLIKIEQQPDDHCRSGEVGRVELFVAGRFTDREEGFGILGRFGEMLMLLAIELRQDFAFAHRRLPAGQ